ncbi:peptidase [Reichenbachiella sp. 5M10]|uniref:PepSY-associated TM helix domain-containing protein n=1 Tax=Reichenbachiella sp. 5M10 TaxID=1889772 RepID=UPI000C15F08E|nr:PepSY domain-containing protein [Reichenbachiella sp. 5M10]PIB34986.1 peptidase [Reichenbachiella sp. 5M10]
MSISKKAVRVWFEIHKWTSLICTVFLLLLCLTGLPLIFHEEIEHLMGEEPEAIVMPADTPKMALDSIVMKAKEARPDEVVRFVFLGGDLPNVVTVFMADSISAPPDNANMVSMDDRTGQILAQPKFNEGFMYIMFKLHVDLFAGIPGKLFLGFMGLLFVIAIVSGLMLYSPIMKKYDFGMVRTEKSPRIKWLDLHNVLGVVTVAWALVVGLTGVINTTSDIVLGMWQQGQLAEMIAPYKDAEPLTGAYSSLDAAVDVALAAAPGMSTSIVAFPGTVFTSKHHYAVFVKGQTPLTERLVKPALIDAKTGELTDMRAMPWYINAIFISQPLHFGDYGGLPLKIIWTVFDLITIVVLISGLYLWVVRRKAQSTQIKRLEELEEEKTLEPAI